MTHELLSRHPLHASILESVEDLHDTPDEQQSYFIATLSSILTDAFIASDPQNLMPAFLASQGVQILSFKVWNPNGDIIPGSDAPIGEINAAHLQQIAQHPTRQISTVSGKFALCSIFDELGDLLSHPTLTAGGTLGFTDPIFESGLILIQVTRATQAEWSLRLVDQEREAD